MCGDATVVNAGAKRRAPRSTVGTASRSMFDFLCDGRWHAKDTVISVGVASVLKDEYERAVTEGKRLRKNAAQEHEYADSGARYLVRSALRIAQRNGRISSDPNNSERVRMTAQVARQWRRMRSAEETANQSTEAPPSDGVSRQRFGEERVIAGWREFDAWSLSPLSARDVAYVRPNVDVPIEELRRGFPSWELALEPDGLISIAAPCGTPVKDVVTQWLAEQGIFHEGVRDARNVRRRDISKLPPEFLEELVTYYTAYAHRRIRGRHANSMQKLVGDADDIAGEVALWVMECIAGFDPTHGVPFGAWLTKQLPNKVMDLNRASFGRTAADAEMRRAKAMEDFEAKHGVSPTQEQLREILGLSEAEFQRKERDLAHLRGLRATSTLDTAPDAPELPVPDITADPEGDALRLEQNQMISRALLAASGEWDPETGRAIKLRHLGFLIVYLVTWQEWTRGDLSLLAGRAARVVTEEVNAVQDELAERLDFLRAGRPLPERQMPTPLASC